MCNNIFQAPGETFSPPKRTLVSLNMKFCRRSSLTSRSGVRIQNSIGIQIHKWIWAQPGSDTQWFYTLLAEGHLFSAWKLEAYYNSKNGPTGGGPSPTHNVEGGRNFILYN
jgi:hypothetical protein